MRTRYIVFELSFFADNKILMLGNGPSCNSPNVEVFCPVLYYVSVGVKGILIECRKAFCSAADNVAEFIGIAVCVQFLLLKLDESRSIP